MDTKKTADAWKSHLNMEPIELGGYFGLGQGTNETTYRASLPDRFDCDHQFYSTNYYMLANEGDGGTSRPNVLSLHQLKQDEQWFLHQGGGLTLYIFTKEGNFQEITLEANTVDSAILQAVAPGQSWFGAVQKVGMPYTLAGCSLAPAWTPSDSTTATREIVEQLKVQFPAQSELLERLFIGDE